MYAAASNENHKVIETLIKNGAKVNAKDKYGKTAFDYSKKKSLLIPLISYF